MNHHTINLEQWVQSAPVEQSEFRQAVHLVLAAITKDIDLQKTMIMKGGLLMAIRYQSSRFTKDVDFSSSLTRSDLDIKGLCEKLDRSLALVGDDSDYGLDCRIQSWRINPSNENASFPNIEISVGYAYKGEPKHRRLIAKQCPTVLGIDFNLNEPIFNIEKLDIGDGAQIQTYMYTDIVAEKYRSLLQQEVRNRYRRQDTYDLCLLVGRDVSKEERKQILYSLLHKARSRGIEPTRDSLSNPELKRRAAQEYSSLADEVSGPLPDFDESFKIVERFYRLLPWGAETL